MEYKFNAYGHENITSKHKNTFEFTKDENIGLEADCIVGVKADYDLNKLKEFLKNKEKIKIVISVDGLKEEVNCIVNPDFNDYKEIVVRKSEFKSERTLGIRADKTSSDFSKEFVDKLRKSKINVKLM